MGKQSAPSTADDGLFPRHDVAAPDPQVSDWADVDVDDLRPVGAMRDASNTTVLALAVQPDSYAYLMVYKPIQGTRPLWDFPAQTLSARECISYQLSQRTGLDIVPPTFWVDSSLGPGSAQLWIGSRGLPVRVMAEDIDKATTGDLTCLEGVATPGRDSWESQELSSAGADLVDVLESVPESWHSVLQLDSEDGECLHVAHADTDRLRLLALFDVITNNADRKIGHIVGSAGRFFGIDNGLTFHVEPKLRTVLWGFAGQSLRAEELEFAEAMPAALAACEHADSLSAGELDAVGSRVEDLLRAQTFPRPAPGRPNVPWPPW